MASPQSRDILYTSVFPRLGIYTTSFVARQDNLICEVGRQLLRSIATLTGNDEEFIQCVPCVMINLAQLLLECQDADPRITYLIDLCSPEMFDTVLRSILRLAGPLTGPDRVRHSSRVIRMMALYMYVCQIAEILHPWEAPQLREVVRTVCEWLVLFIVA